MERWPAKDGDDAKNDDERNRWRVQVGLSAVNFISSVERSLGNLLMRTRVAEMPWLTARPIATLTFLFAATGFGQQCSFAKPLPRLSRAALLAEGSAPALAFSKYVASIQERNPFTERGQSPWRLEPRCRASRRRAAWWRSGRQMLPSAANTES